MTPPGSRQCGAVSAVLSCNTRWYRRDLLKGDHGQVNLVTILVYLSAKISLIAGMRGRAISSSR
ncbi:hypothetical protein ASZ90_016592 [hydrocarbon metagenome]|uniref:Uncharacterized protein n=1 Tax=hydrocarbon metagenome TaxID=938273 RepID=A0A0W8ENG3_9ZZZZ